MAEVDSGLKPIPDSYWVVPGRFLAGEYPGSRDPSTAEARLRALLDAGVTCFVDLTEADEPLAPYHHLLGPMSAGAAGAVRFGVTDVSVPTSQAFAARILNAIDDALARGALVYLHCWGGVGRTGTIVGCWLARHGHGGRAALQRLGELWAQCPKSRLRRSPETAEQAEFVVDWQE